MPSYSGVPGEGDFALEFFASQIGRSEMECSALRFSDVRWKPRKGQLAKMRSFHQSKRSDNKQYAVEVRWGIFLRIWRIFFLFLRAVVNIPIQTSIIPPWLLLRKMIISQLELGPLVGWLEIKAVDAIKDNLVDANSSTTFSRSVGPREKRLDSECEISLSRWWAGRRSLQFR